MPSTLLGHAQKGENTLQDGRAELSRLMVPNRLDLLLAGCSPALPQGWTAQLEGSQGEKIGWQRIQREVKPLLLGQEIAFSPRACVSVKGPPWPGTARAVLRYPDVTRTVGKMQVLAVATCEETVLQYPGTAQPRARLPVPLPRHAWALGAGQHPPLLAGSRRGQAAALRVAETLLQRQDLALGLILAWQSSANAAPLDGSQRSRGWNFTFLHGGACSEPWVCAGNSSLQLRRCSDSPSQAATGAASPTGAAGWDQLVAQILCLASRKALRDTNPCMPQA